MQLHTLTVQQLSQLLERKEVSSLELTKAYLDRIIQLDGDTGAFVAVAKESALTHAQAVDEKRSRGEELSSLAGIPMAVGDNICTEGIKTTCGSKILHNFIPPYDAAVCKRLKKADAVLLGKCNLQEFSMGSSTEAGRGSAAAVATGEAVFAIGSDTGGCIRQPALLCGVVGLKPTYGYVPRSGLISYASSLDQIGPFTRDITDLALVLNAITGHEVEDSSSAHVEVSDFRKSLVDDVKGMRIGLPKEYLEIGTEPRVMAKIREVLRMLEEAGAICEEVDMPHTEYAAPAHYIISSAEASSNLARYDGVRYGLRVDAEDLLNMFNKTRGQGFGQEVKRRIMQGTYFLSTANYQDYYVKALKVRTLVKQDFDKAFAKYDCLLTPIRPAAAFKTGEQADDPIAMYQNDVFTIPANLAGVPAMSMPLGMAEGQPIGLQLMARHFAEGTLLRLGYTLEQLIYRGSR